MDLDFRVGAMPWRFCTVEKKTTTRFLARVIPDSCCFIFVRPRQNRKRSRGFPFFPPVPASLRAWVWHLARHTCVRPRAAQCVRSDRERDGAEQMRQAGREPPRAQESHSAPILVRVTKRPISEEMCKKDLYVQFNSSFRNNRVFSNLYICQKKISSIRRPSELVPVWCSLITTFDISITMFAGSFL